MAEIVRRALAMLDGIVVGQPRPRYRAGSVAFFRSLNIWFWAIVGLPTLIAGVYYFAIASDLYMSEVKFVVRGPGKASPSIMTAMLSSGTPPVSDDTYAVHDYLLSRDAVRELDREDGLRALLSRPEGDFVSRFPGIRFWRRDFEALYDAYSRFVSVEVDATSGVSTLQVKAYRPEDAQRIAHSLLAFSEQLVNRLNERARHDALAVFQRQVDTTERDIAKIQAQLTKYRIQQQMLDPKSASAGPLELLAQENAELATAKGRLAETARNAPHSPQIRLMRTRIASIEKLIADERAKITGGSESIATSLSEYERLDVQRRLSEKILASALASLESARLQAQRQQLYLESITQPNLADYPLYPKRVASFATIVAACLLAYGIAWLLIASVREHAAA
jgi:capsular polysaccharide transport system permease protein